MCSSDLRSNPSLPSFLEPPWDNNRVKTQTQISKFPILFTYPRHNSGLHVTGYMDRSENMRRIRAKNTTPEIAVRRELYRRGLRYRCNYSGLPGKPDIAFLKAKVAVFIDGCFWHRHIGCGRTTTPKSNLSYWSRKFERTVERDLSTTNRLNEIGFDVVRLWECEIKANLFQSVTAVTSRLQRP